MSRIRDAVAWATTPVRWTWRQVSGLARSSWDYIRNFRVDDVLPPSIRDLLNFAFSMLPRAFGVRGATRRQQINANAVLIGVTFLTGFLTGGLAWILIGLWGILLLFAWFFRGTPAGESLWTRFRRRLPIKRDYDLPLWRSD